MSQGMKSPDKEYRDHEL